MNDETLRTNELKSRLAVAMETLTQVTAELNRISELLNEPVQPDEMKAVSDSLAVASDYNNKTIILTENMIKACRTPRGGFTKATMYALGAFKPGVKTKGWIKALVGTSIRRGDFNIALSKRMK